MLGQILSPVYSFFDQIFHPSTIYTCCPVQGWPGISWYMDQENNLTQGNSNESRILAYFFKWQKGLCRKSVYTFQLLVLNKAYIQPRAGSTNFIRDKLSANKKQKIENRSAEDMFVKKICKTQKQWQWWRFRNSVAVTPESSDKYGWVLWRVFLLSEIFPLLLSLLISVVGNQWSRSFYGNIGILYDFCTLVYP